MNIEETHYLINYKECGFRYQPIIVKYYEYKYYNVHWVPKGNYFAQDGKTSIHQNLSAHHSSGLKIKVRATRIGDTVTPYE